MVLVHLYLPIQISIIAVCDELGCVRKDGPAHRFYYKEPNGKGGKLIIRTLCTINKEYNYCNNDLPTKNRRA